MGIYNDNHCRTCEITWTLVACTNLCMTVEAQVQKDSSPCAVLFAHLLNWVFHISDFRRTENSDAKFLTKLFPRDVWRFEICIYIYICMYTHVSSLVCMRVSWCLGFSRFLRVQINGHVMWIYPPYLGPATQKGLPVVLRMTLCSHTPNRLDVNDVDPRESQTDEMRWICFSRLNWDTRLSNSFTMWVQPRTQTTGLPSSFATCSKK